MLAVEQRLLAESCTDILSLPAHTINRVQDELRRVAQVGWSVWGYRRLTLIERLAQFFRGAAKDEQQLLRETPGLEVLFVFHSDGYLREAALERMDGPCQSPFDVAIVLYRLNDWVGPIRRAAVRCAQRRLPLTPVSHLAAAWVGLADRMHLWARVHEEQRAVLASLVERQEVRNAIAAWIDKERSGPVTAIFDQVLRLPAFEPCLQDWATGARRPQVRALALKTLLEGKARWVIGYRRHMIDKAYGVFRRIADMAERPLAVSPDRQALMVQGASDPSPIVRRIVAAALVRDRNALPGWRQIADLLLMDRNPSVRERAEWVIAEMQKTAGEPHPAA
ncbi:hypothetical protein AMEJIAPC_01022 [Caulobacter sp. NIBR1757]|nr:hypothetical protein AMEJIAPC_01022 [Caulobacter sp. NIBR1757]